MFPPSGLSSDNGWDFGLVPAAGLFVGSVSGAPVSSAGSSETIDLSRTMTAGFRTTPSLSAGADVALNLATGAHSPVQAGAVAWCQSIITYKTQVGYQSGTGSTDYERIGQEAIKPCHTSGASATAPQTVPGFVGTDVGGLTVWSESSEVAAAPTSS